MQVQPDDGPYKLLLSRRRLLTAGLAFAASFEMLPLDARTFSAREDNSVPDWPADLQVFAATLMDSILPEDDGMGALSVGGPQFLQEVIHGVLRPGLRTGLIEGLGDLRLAMTAQIGAPFERQSVTRRHNELARFDSATYLALAAGIGTKAQLAYVMLKEITLIAFFTNEEVAKSLLDYEPVPGQYEPDLQVNKTTRSYYEDEMAGSYFKFAGKMP